MLAVIVLPTYNEYVVKLLRLLWQHRWAAVTEASQAGFKVAPTTGSLFSYGTTSGVSMGLLLLQLI